MRLYINIDSIVKNAEKLRKRMLDSHIELVPVTKGVLSSEPIIQGLKKIGFTLFGESRIENLLNLSQNTDFMFLRPPVNHEIEKVVRHTKYSIQSSIITMKQMQRTIIKNHSEHKMILMIDMGDLRDGVYYKNKEVIDEILNGIEKDLLVGVATNLGCFGGVIPNYEIMRKFSEVSEYIKSKNDNVKIISGGNTTTIPLVENNEIGNTINQFRIGEAILLGTDITRNKKIDYLDQNTMFLEAELIEVYKKRNEDNVEFGYDAFGRKKEKPDNKIKKRGVVYMGEIDVIPELIEAIDEDVKIIGSSSDQTVLDLTNSHNNYKIGDTLRFKLSYGSMVKAMASPFVEKIYI